MLHKRGLEVHAHISSILEAGIEGHVQDHLQLYSESEVSLCFLRPCIINRLVGQEDTEFEASLSYTAAP